jgi:prepilin-type N-terminal cleavage/methylation domain-containing protein
MKTKTQRRGFTLIELLVVISIIAMLAAGAYAGYGAMMPKIRANSTATKASTIGKWLAAYALDEGGSFPVGESSANNALRELFKNDKYGADEGQFQIENDPYHKTSASKKGPDGDKGKGPEYTQALEVGENPFAYVSGLSNADEGRLPLLANGFAGSPGKWTKDKNAKGGVFHGKYAVVLRVGGSAAAHELKEEDNYEVKEKAAGQMVNIFTSDFGTPSTVLDPE